VVIALGFIADIGVSQVVKTGWFDIDRLVASAGRLEEGVTEIENFNGHNRGWVE
jgi:hypothetical protein